MNKVNNCKSILSDDTYKLLDDEINSHKYIDNYPFEHTVIDNFLNEETYKLLVNFVKKKKPEDYNIFKKKNNSK